MSRTLLFPSLSQNFWDPLLVIKKLVITKGYGVGASTMEGQNAFAPTLCASFTRWMVKARVIRLRMIEVPNLSDQIAFCASHSFLEEVKRMLAT